MTESRSLSHPELLDRIYSAQRHIYDLSRKYYLFGRDRLLEEMNALPGIHILEVGCGTGRNLIALARLNPGLSLFGIDASRAMLETASSAIERAKLPSPITLEFGLAETFDPTQSSFRSSSFDKVFFSYSLSMIPDWKGALLNALRLLRPGGVLFIVDFWDQSGYPVWFQRLLRWWLSLFHVEFKPEHLLFLDHLQREKKISLELSPVGRRYAYLAKVRLLSQ
ncbi:MAG: methyltransferase domain-containing protein [Bdellovibrionales bacterium]|nr:methyltransferase domain-containing protein [Bdellovibrionales bacterium]